jgi:cysteine-rich repeat protein
MCGDGTVCGTEECDDGNLNNLDGCDANCTFTGCGNGVVTWGEECDDGNAYESDGCSSSCTCVLTGTWQAELILGYGWGTVGPSMLVLVDEGSGGLNGFSYSAGDPEATFETFSGNRTGRDILLGDWAFRMLDCDTLRMVDSITRYRRLSHEACGNGGLEPGEVCDDGNFHSDDQCTMFCEPPRCGDRLIAQNEECDDGNLTELDGCSSACTLQECGNLVVEVGEECDDGNRVDGDGCNGACQIQICGNGIIEEPEICDDGNAIPEDGCSTGCFVECAGGVTGTWEWVLYGGAVLEFRFFDQNGAITAWLVALSPPVAAEQINGSRVDDILTLDFLGTTQLLSCDQFQLDFGFPFPSLMVTRVSTTICGDGALDAGEECDDGNFENGDLCTVLCAPPRCGDGVREPYEGCDDGNLADGDGCTATCTVQVCGNGALEPGESCDDGNTLNGDGCSSRCTVHTCSDAVLEQGEECDDGNLVEGDGCSPTCVVECLELSGSWADDYVFSPFTFSILEPEPGLLQGAWLINPSTAFPLTGTRSGLVAGSGVTFLVDIDGDTSELSGTLGGCDVIEIDWGLGRYLIRATTDVCGDGTIQDGEECDDGNFDNGDLCTVTCEWRGCGNGTVEPEEECDDGNTEDGDGCSSDCREEALPEGASQAAAAGESVTTDSEGDGATTSDPIETTATVQRSGAVSIDETSAGVASPIAELSVTQEVTISVPPGTPEEPAGVVFKLDPSRVPAGQRYAAVELFRDGALVPSCVNESGIASPDPCVADRDLLDDGDLQITVLMSEGGTWSFGLASQRMLIAGKSLTLRDGADLERGKLALAARDERIGLAGPAGLGDPTCAGLSGGGATLQIIGVGGSGQRALIDLPCENWSLIGTPENPRGYRYRDRGTDRGTCRRVVLRPGSLRLACGGRGSSQPLAYDLTAAGEGSVGAVLTSGISTSYCANFDAAAVVRDNDQVFRARDAGAPAACPVAH